MLDIKNLSDLLIKLTKMGKLTWIETDKGVVKDERFLKGRKTSFSGIEVEISLMLLKNTGLFGLYSEKVGGLIISNSEEKIIFTTSNDFLRLGEKVDERHIFYLACQIQKIVESKGLEKNLTETLSQMLYS
ncbi:MAG: hypothetical protein KAI71_00160 [Candidatus Pacebacteria bacterium]|nr:hypothetical protein [Candidatus Paceibacterota bacterium]